MPHECPFCERVGRGDVSVSTSFAVSFPDGFPVSAGHALVTPKRHIASLFELTEDEQADVWRLVATVRRNLDERYGPAGFNIGLNDGAAAGQTIAHAHVHVIPRYEGDTPDPRGGVRWVLPAKAAYWING